MMCVRFNNFIYGLGGNQQNARKCFRLTLHLQKQSPPRLCLLCPAPLKPVNSAPINRLTLLRKYHKLLCDSFSPFAILCCICSCLNQMLPPQ